MVGLFIGFGGSCVCMVLLKVEDGSDDDDDDEQVSGPVCGLTRSKAANNSNTIAR